MAGPPVIGRRGCHVVPLRTPSAGQAIPVFGVAGLVPDDFLF